MLINSIKRGNKIVSRAWLFFLDLVFPVECLGCRQEPDWLCESCFKKITIKSKQYCLHCKKENYFGEFCPACKINYYLNGVWIASSYEDKLVSKMIKILKYYFIKDLALDLANLIKLMLDGPLNRAKILRPSLTDGLGWKNLNLVKTIPLAILNFKDNLIMPVPLSKKRFRWRGFNQAELISRAYAAICGLELNTAGLVRIAHKKPQAKLNEVGRLANIKNCYIWIGGNLNNKNIILVDDVVTTGATLNECAKILKANGAGEVWGLVIAKG